MTSITSHNSDKTPGTCQKQKSPVSLNPWAVFFWLLIWQLASWKLNQPILLVSPVAVLKRLFELTLTAAFWKSIGFSLLRISTGFLCGVFAGSLLAALSSRFRRIRELFTPLILLAKTIPVASFIILVLIWIPSRNLSVFISFLMVLPVIYTNVLDGICSTNRELLEMAQVFSLSSWRKIRYIYISQVLPFFSSACTISLGLCWKAGIAAEVIGIPEGSIGENLYNAKVYIDTPDLFAWTLVIVIISVTFEKFVLFLLKLLVRRLQRL